MYKKLYYLSAFFLPLNIFSQENLTPEKLWQLGRLSADGITKDRKAIVYSVRTYNVTENKGSVTKYLLALNGNKSIEIANSDSLLLNNRISPDGKNKILFDEVKIVKNSGKDLYPELEKSEAMIYDDLNYRHWDEWEDGLYSHVFVQPLPGTDSAFDLMAGEPYDCPLKPFGGNEDAIWSPDSKNIIYVTKKKYGKDYAMSTNTDIFSYNIADKKTINLSESMGGYDTKPSFSANGELAWLSMKRDGYESDKNDIVIRHGSSVINLTATMDETVFNYAWSNDGREIFFTSPTDGTVQLFSVTIPGNDSKPEIRQITKGDFDVHSIIGQVNNTFYVTRMDINHADEIFSVDLSTGSMLQISHVNDLLYKTIKLSKTEKRTMTTTDGQKMLSWIIYPPDFNPVKKYPVLLYCQGGPQSALTQYYSFRWNFQLMAANGYIVVAPNRRGMPGHGTLWNEQISKDYGGQAINDYLTAIDEFSKEPFVDKNRVGCIGASFGGYSVFYLAGIHNKRFKSFIAHDGMFNLKSMYGTTEEMWFVNWDFGGDYWTRENAAAQKSYTLYDPSNFVDKWDTPILIIQGGKDYRTPIGQSQEAFQAAQLRGIKSRFLYFPNENHWVLKAQNALVWQREFYRWLKETL